MVSYTDCKCWQKAQDNDRSSGPEIANCSVASGNNWRGSSWRRVASRVIGELRQAKLSEPDEHNSSASDDDPRWRSPEAGHGVNTGFENGSAAEELRRRCA